MSYFNAEQQDYMRDLAKIPMEEKCYCGWYRVDECQRCKKSHPGKTCSDKILEREAEVRQ